MSARRIKLHKHRLNLTLSREAMRTGKRIARIERRSFSNMLEVLLTREMERRFPNGETDQNGEAGGDTGGTRCATTKAEVASA